jgi:hypothetical protein
MRENPLVENRNARERTRVPFGDVFLPDWIDGFEEWAHKWDLESWTSNTLSVKDVAHCISRRGKTLLVSRCCPQPPPPAIPSQQLCLVRTLVIRHRQSDDGEENSPSADTGKQLADEAGRLRPVPSGEVASLNRIGRVVGGTRHGGGRHGAQTLVKRLAVYNSGRIDKHSRLECDFLHCPQQFLIVC